MSDEKSRKRTARWLVFTASHATTIAVIMFVIGIIAGNDGHDETGLAYVMCGWTVAMIGLTIMGMCLLHDSLQGRLDRLEERVTPKQARQDDEEAILLPCD